MTASAVAFDADGDGDLDILTHPVNGPLAFFRNNAQDANVIAFELEDHVGNRNGIGAVIEIEDDRSHVQRREIQLGGGFMSFDTSKVHFGLGSAQTIQQIRIKWAKGVETRIPGPIEPGSILTVTRR
jgi:hypothetical protein